MDSNPSAYAALRNEAQPSIPPSTSAGEVSASISCSSTSVPHKTTAETSPHHNSPINQPRVHFFPDAESQLSNAPSAPSGDVLAPTAVLPEPTAATAPQSDPPTNPPHIHFAPHAESQPSNPPSDVPISGSAVTKAKRTAVKATASGTRTRRLPPSVPAQAEAVPPKRSSARNQTAVKRTIEDMRESDEATGEPSGQRTSSRKRNKRRD
jgi:hypothetical protein